MDKEQKKPFSNVLSWIQSSDDIKPSVTPLSLLRGNSGFLGTLVLPSQPIGVIGSHPCYLSHFRIPTRMVSISELEESEEKIDSEWTMVDK